MASRVLASVHEHGRVSQARGGSVSTESRSTTTLSEQRVEPSMKKCDNCDCVLSRVNVPPSPCDSCTCALANLNLETDSENWQPDPLGRPTKAPSRRNSTESIGRVPVRVVSFPSMILDADTSIATNSGPKRMLSETGPVPASSLQTSASTGCLDLEYEDARRHPLCDRCDACDDTCAQNACAECHSSRQRIRNRKCQKQFFTMCQVQRRNTMDTCWIVVKRTVYDATPLLTNNVHPGGVQSILRKGGTDCSHDFLMHSKSGKLAWKKYAIGKLVDCPRAQCKQTKRSWLNW